METLLFALAVLACPVGMGAMMWWMSRHMIKPQATKSDAGVPQGDQSAAWEVARLRAEVDQLRAAQADRQHTEGNR